MNAPSEFMRTEGKAEHVLLDARTQPPAGNEQTAEPVSLNPKEILFFFLVPKKRKEKERPLVTQDQKIKQHNGGTVARSKSCTTTRTRVSPGRCETFSHL